MKAGFSYKLYWRVLPGTWKYHCFESGNRRSEGFTSLCGEVRIDASHGQDVNRPRSELRCARCDGREADIHRVDECLDENITRPERPLH